MAAQLVATRRCKAAVPELTMVGDSLRLEIFAARAESLDIDPGGETSGRAPLERRATKIEIGNGALPAQGP